MEPPRNKKCAICDETVHNGLVECPKCGRGIFVSAEEREAAEEPAGSRPEDGEQGAQPLQEVREALKKAASEVVGREKEYARGLRIVDGTVIETGATAHEIPIEDIVEVGLFNWKNRNPLFFWNHGVEIKTRSGGSHLPDVGSHRAEEFIHDIKAIQELARSTVGHQNIGVARGVSEESAITVLLGWFITSVLLLAVVGAIVAAILWVPWDKLNTERVPDEEIVGMAAEVCSRGQGISQAAEYDDALRGPHPVVLLASSGKEHEETYSMAGEWAPETIASLELVACVEKDETVEAGRCYARNPMLYCPSREHRAEVTLKRATTAEVIGRGELRGGLPDCPSLIYNKAGEPCSAMGSEGEWVGPHVSGEDAMQWLVDYVYPTGKADEQEQ